MPSIFDEQEPLTREPTPVEQPLIRPFYEPETQAETARKSGMAYSAGIVLVTSVAFMLLLGWGADLILGTSPWGIVAGIVLGSVIGFVQFFRITSRIFKQSDDVPAVRPLMMSSDEDPGQNPDREGRGYEQL